MKHHENYPSRMAGSSHAPGKRQLLRIPGRRSPDTRVGDMYTYIVRLDGIEIAVVTAWSPDDAVATVRANLDLRAVQYEPNARITWLARPKVVLRNIKKGNPGNAGNS